VSRAAVMVILSNRFSWRMSSRSFVADNVIDVINEHVRGIMRTSSIIINR